MVSTPNPGEVGRDGADASRAPDLDRAPGDELETRAVHLARRWITASASAPEHPAAERLAAVLRDPQGLPFTMGFVDGVMRPESMAAAAANLHRVSALAPDFLPWHLRGAVRLGGAVARALPVPTVPLARRALREMVGHLVIDARPEKLGPALEQLRAKGRRLNLNLLGEAVLGEREADARLAGIHELIRRDDVDYVSVKVSAIESRISMWAFDEMVERIAQRLLPLYLSAAGAGDGADTAPSDPPSSDAPAGAEAAAGAPPAPVAPTFINLDMEEYRDLDLTIAVFTRLLEDPRLRGFEAGLVLQAYLPDALPALQELTVWARERVREGGAPIKVRLVKGANLAMERVDAAVHGWAPAPYDAKVDTDANYLRCLSWAMDASRTAAVRLGVAGHNLFDIAYAWLLAGERGVRADVEFEMLLGMAQGQIDAVADEVGQVLLYTPVVRPDHFDAAISYLVRRLQENASAENFLSAAFELADSPAMFERERERFLASVRRMDAPSLGRGPRRAQRRGADPAVDPDARGTAGEPGAPSTTRPPAPEGPAGEQLTQRVLGIARGVTADTAAVLPGTPGGVARFGADEYLETAIYAPRERGRAGAAAGTGAPGFLNTPDSDPALADTRAWARDVLERVPGSTAGMHTILEARIDDERALDRVLEQVRDAAATWGALPAAERGTVLQRAAAAIERRRGELIEVAAAETGKPFAEGDVEVSEAVDFAAYYAATARELDSIAGAVFVPSRVTLVVPPWNFPIAIPAGGVLAALAAGSGVVLKPAPEARRCAAVLAEALWSAGVPRDLLALVDVDEEALGRPLVTHPLVERVLLTGSWETARLFRSWRAELPLLAETSGKNAMIVTPSADVDLAVADLVRSAFGHAGQKCSAASLVILVGAMGSSARFARQLVDATQSLRVGPPADPRSEVGPLIQRPSGKLEWALTTLDAGERWLVEPRPLDDSGRLWSPGIRTGVAPGSRFHREEFFGPVLGVMHAHSLEHAIELQNAVAYGLTAGLHTQDPDELARWLAGVEAGNLYVNRATTGAIVQRQPFGGWKRSSVGPGAKAGGPNSLIGLGSWRAAGGGAPSSTLHLRGLDTRITGVIEASQPSLAFEAFEMLRRGALSDAVAWDREFGAVKDVTGLGIERNLMRYRPVPVAVRAAAGTPLQEVLRVALAGLRTMAPFTLSVPEGLPPAVRRALSELGVPVFVERDVEWVQRVRGPAAGTSADVEHGAPRASAAQAPETGAPTADGQPSAGAEVRVPRVRIIGPTAQRTALAEVLAIAVEGDPDLAVYAGEVTTAGRIELLPFLHEQAISITAHRFGTPDPWSESVI
ncbi:MAG TPA: bifunctional proline dehydrogenase/L-glutamate gamma-semialdehyde dehydrogenase [Microbacteriaceae bacterium]|jgi:RHH-type proline utilization regulon transcriptional repressor/proline dehydrogenase/delta 1-pyrroline-5-carboxylate dehydrogenase|nr:bifunctional proline dehydrogenase/L-glutamate gamma-semialdehyde dehydrogenase [Microbacteriaceae bacterium]HPZ33621.1 bifunctional proline dehydrogenase/L-glutamate gamma-semialdehyde dehydrogenase [Microbacteriaceae bacterium]HQC92255.1 bifunctional proline dehydrogenase/L-glutamate gamma-semialdehyde dehydrogenase [Microbacteriaceae bacterium]